MKSSKIFDLFPCCSCCWALRIHKHIKKSCYEGLFQGTVCSCAGD